MDLSTSYGKAEAPAFADTTFWEVDMEKQYGFTDLTAAGFNGF